MKHIIALFIFVTIFQGFESKAQSVNGRILQTGNITVVKLWGTHAERGYAYGYLLGEKMNTVFTNYLQPQFGSYYQLVRQKISSGENFIIDSNYIAEAQGIIDGMNAAGTNQNSLDYIDVLVCNVYLDFESLATFKSSDSTKPGCSSLITWGENSNNNGNAFVTRHVDWNVVPTLYQNNVIVAHIPTEANEQPWAMIGYAGQISALSGINASGMAAFQHMMSGSGAPSMSNMYIPIWFAIRKALEENDYNNDGINDTKDILAVFEEADNGYSDGYIVSTMAANGNNDTTIATIFELAADIPYITVRSNNFSDNIQGNHLYAANSPIKRNNSLAYCSRYNQIIGIINDVMNIANEDQWNIMTDYSTQTSNMQMMQYIPFAKTLKISSYQNAKPAYQNTPIEINTDSLFLLSESVINNKKTLKKINIYPNPTKNDVFINEDTPISTIKIIDTKGNILYSKTYKISKNKIKINLTNYASGIYFIVCNNEYIKKIIKQ